MLVVTGAAGFIGSNIVATLNQRGRADVIVVDKPGAAEHTGNLRDLRYELSLAQDALPRWLEQNARHVDGVIHMGACSDTTASDRAYIMANNLEYTRTLWTFCTRAEKRFVYASSAATYGDGSAGYDDAADLQRLKPLNLYGESKHLFDLFALNEALTPPGWAGLKFFNVYGPREQHKGRMASMVFHGFNQIRASGKVRLFESDRPGIPHGGQQRDFIYVKDCVAAVLHFVEAPAAQIGSVYNVGTGVARSFADLARATFAAMGLEPNIEYIPMPSDLKGKYQYFTQATTARLRESGFAAPFHSLEDGVKDYVQYLLKSAPR